ncbi:MAG: hypothetical protein ACKVS9_14240 [Phycisphaerae bacterium]
MFFLTLLSLLLALPIGGTPSVTAILVAAQEEQFRERQVLDPDKDDWVTTPVEAGTVVAELEQARSLLARGEFKPALKILKPWTEQNFDHERYYEAVYLLGECYFQKPDFYQAYLNFDIVADATSGDLFHKAIRRQMDVARAFLAGQKRIFWGFLRIPAYDDGLEILDRVWQRVPGTRAGEESLKTKADYQFENGEMDLAQDEYANLAKQYPSGRWITLATLRSAEAAASSFGGPRFDDRPLIDADDRYREFKRLFPGPADREGIDQRLEAIRNQRAAKDYDIANWYERTKQIDSAGYYYRLILKDWPGTPAALDATARLRALGLAEETSPQPRIAPPATMPDSQPAESKASEESDNGN